MCVTFAERPRPQRVFSLLLTVTLANALHPGANGASAGLAVVFPHQLASQPFGTVQSTLLHRFLATLGPFPRKLFPEVYILREKFAHVSQHSIFPKLR